MGIPVFSHPRFHLRGTVCGDTLYRRTPGIGSLITWSWYITRIRVSFGQRTYINLLVASCGADGLIVNCADETEFGGLGRGEKRYLRERKGQDHRELQQPSILTSVFPSIHPFLQTPVE